MEAQNEWQYAEEAQKQPENPHILLGIGDRFLSKVTLMDLFAGFSMMGLIARGGWTSERGSKESYENAKAMLKAREEAKCPTSS